MASLGDALEYPMEHDDWVKTLLIGGVLSIFAFLLIPIIVVYGYIVRVIRHSLDGDPRPPEFGDWGDLLVDGLKMLVILIVYMLIPAIVAAVTVGGSVAAMATGTRGGAAAGVAGLVVGFLVSFVLALAFGYVAVAAIVNFAREGSVGAAFDFDTLRPILFDSDYAVAWALSVAVFIAVGIVTGVLNIIPFIGAIIGAFVGFYAQIVAARLWADGYGAARGYGTDDWDSAGESTV
jgi:hypothetical protein